MRRLVALGSAAAALAVSDVAMSQTRLPEIVVTAPSPLSRPASPGATEPAEPGTLPIVTDQFATVTVVPKEELQRAPGAQLGDLLFSKPGITGSSFAPGASSRPIVRGLDVNRVGIVENGIGGSGVSDLGEDHFVPIDPLVTNQVEVVRGPATLRWGSQSIGGVVSAVDNRIPEALPCDASAVRTGAPLATKAPTPAVGSADPCATLELRGAGTSVDNGLNGGVLVDAGKDNFAFHADVFGRNADDYRIPKYPYLFVPDQPFNGRQPNSSLHTEGGAVGGSMVFDQGFFGVAVTQNNALYHIPGLDGAQHLTRIDAQQTKVMSKGEFRPAAGLVDTIRFWLGVTDYKHNEIGLADPLDLSTDGIRQTFTNKEQE